MDAASTTIGKLHPYKVGDEGGAVTASLDARSVKQRAASSLSGHANPSSVSVLDPKIESILCEAQTRPPSVARGANRINGAGQWRCASCGIFMPKDFFSTKSAERSGIQASCKVCARQAKYMWSCTLRGNMLTLIRSASCRALKRGHICSLTLEQLLDTFHTQYGLCFYSEVPLSLQPNSNWRMSLERLSNEHGYTEDNIALVACEFNTPGCAQWSREKVKQLPILQTSNVDMLALEVMVQEARGRVRQSSLNRGPCRQANEAGDWYCKTCDKFKGESEFYRSHAGGLSYRCRVCARAYSQLYRRTLRGNAIKLLANAKSRAKRRGQECTLLRGDIFDMLWMQGGRCFYSGVPMECILPESHWRMSLERLSNDVGYTQGNCVLVAHEFNTSDFSRNKNTMEVFGTAQWSRQKVHYVWGPSCPIL